MKPLRLTLFVLLALVIMPALAFASGDPAATRGGDSIGDALSKLLVGTVVVAIGAIGKRLWSWLGQKTATAKLVRQFDQHAIVQQIASEAIDYAEELAHQALKAGRKLEGRLKESAAVERALDLLERAGIDPGKVHKAAEEELRKVVLARLGANRAPGMVTATLRPVPRS